MAGNVSTKIVYQNSDTFLMAVLKKRDRVDEDALRRVNSYADKGFLEVKWEKTSTRNVLKYNVSNMTALSEYVKQPIAQEKYFGIIGQLQRILEFCGEGGLETADLILVDPKNVYYDVEKRKVRVAYLPLMVNQYKNSNLAKFLVKLHRNAAVEVFDEEIMKKYAVFLDDNMKSKKDRSIGLTHNHIYAFLHDVLGVPLSTASIQARRSPAEVRSGKGSQNDGTTAGTTQQSDSDHTIVVSKPRSAECAAFLRDYNNREIPIDHFPFTIGRKADNDLALSDKGTVSKLHAVISCEDGKFYVEDKNSSNGTFLSSYANGSEKIKKQQLASGDVIYIYDIPFVFNINSSDSPTVIVSRKNELKAKTDDLKKTGMKHIAYLLNTSSKEKVPIFVYPFTCAELSGIIISRENSRTRHSICIENISCPSLSVEGDEVAAGEKSSIFSGCTFQYHGISYKFYEEN